MILYYCGMLGIAAFSITGVMAAGKRGMDLLSIVILGVVTALGGGTLRDVILDVNPVFWISDLTYLWVSLTAALLAFFCVRSFNHLTVLLLYIDALGLALFTVFAAEKTLKLGFTPPVAVIMGLITGISGGLMRDMLTGRMPLILGREFYATPALLGAVLFAILRYYFPQHAFNWIYGVCTILFLRIITIHFHVYYPRKLLYNGINNN